MDDDFGIDQEFLSALAASETSAAGRAGAAGGGGGSGSRGGPSRSPARPSPAISHSGPSARIQQPTPQRLDKRPPPGAAAGNAGVKQPTPQALPQRSAGSSILVSPRQKGNPVLASLKSMPWEYSDIPADYGLGLTTCALFLSLKYHRLHPEYIYTRIRNLQGRYNLRVLLTMVDIPNHEDSLRELSKTSLVNNVTLVLCWSAAEAARYLELYKSYEHAGFAAIRGAQSQTYAEKLVDFVTVPRAVNKADAVALVSTFGSLRAAVNADPETVSVIGGWGEKKVKAWCEAVEEPFRARKGKKAGSSQAAGGSSTQGRRRVLDEAVPLSRVPLRDMAGLIASRSQGEASCISTPNAEEPLAKRPRLAAANEDEEEAMLAAAIEESRKMAEEEERTRAGGNLPQFASEDGGEGEASSSSSTAAKQREELSDGIAAALARLRKDG